MNEIGPLPKEQESTPGEDWQTFENTEIRKQALRLWTIVSNKRHENRVILLSISDFLLGALYELVRAERYEFEHRVNHPPDLVPIVRRSLALSEGHWRRDGTWMAGLHYNSALVRLSAIHHRSLQMVVGTKRPRRSKKRLELSDLRREASAFVKERTGKSWSCSNIAIVHKEVNNLKHREYGTWTGRTVPFITALRAVRETVDLIEVWANEQLRGAFVHH